MRSASSVTGCPLQVGNESLRKDFHLIIILILDVKVQSDVCPAPCAYRGRGIFFWGGG